MAALLVAALGGPAASFGLPQAAAAAPPPILASAFAEEWRWVRFATTSGLPSNSVYDVVETPRGTVWAATQRGPAWYDGYQWHPMSEAAGLPASLPEIAPLGDDELLVAVQRRLFRGNREGLRPIEVTVDGTPYDVLDVVGVGPDHNMLLAAENRNAPVEVLSYDGDTFRRVALTKELVSDQDAVDIWSNGTNAVWLRTMDGLERWQAGVWQTRIPTPVELPLRAEHLIETPDGTGLVSVIYPPESRGIWEWTRGGAPGLNRDEPTDLLESMDISPDGTAVVVYSSGDVRLRQRGVWSQLVHVPAQMAGVLFVKFRDDGDLWVGTQSGLFLFRTSLDRWTHWEVPSPDLRNEILALLRTRDGSIWMGTGRGITIHRDDGTVDWIGSILGTTLEEVTGLAEDERGGVWVSSGSALNGAYRWDGNEWRHYGEAEGLPATHIHRIRKDRSGRLWFLGMAPMSSTGAFDLQPGAFLLDGEEFIPWGTDQGLVHGRVYDFDEASDGTRWFATFGGLSRWRAGEWTHWTIDNGLAKDRVFTLTVDRDDRLWFGDQSSGLGYIDESDRPRYLTAKDGLIHDAVQELRLGPDGELWISTRGGLARYHDGNWLSLDVTTGLSNPHLWPILPFEDKVYVGTYGNGVDILNLAEADFPPPRVVSNASLVNDNTVLVRWEPYAYWGNLPPAVIQTRFRFDGGPWSGWSTARETALSDLPAGGHTFDVQAKGLFGGVDAPADSLSFVARRPFYFGATFLVPLGTLMIFVLLLFVGRRRHLAALRGRDREYQRRLESRVEQRTDALRESEERLRMLLETTHVIPWEADATTWKFTYVGPQAVRILGYPVERWYEPTFWPDHIHPDDVDTALRFCEEQSAVSTQYEFEYRMLAADGEIVWMHDIVSVIAQPERGESAAVLRGFMIDITERKRAEEKRLLAESEALEHRERLAHIARVNMLGEMATGIAHEVNQPLTAVSTYTHACKRMIEAGTMDQAQLLDVLGRIGDEAVRAGDMIHGLKALVRKRESELRICNVNDLVRDVLPLAELEARDRGVEISLDLDEDIADVAADDVQIQQVVLNLIRNAIEATEPGDGRVEICTTDIGGGLVQLEVSDNGLGISGPDPQKVFQPFFSTKDDGMGMGLSISRTIITAHGGEIGHRPSRSGGTTFYFRLRAEQGAEATG